MYAVMNVSSLSASCFSLVCSSVVNGKHITTSLLFSFGMDGLPLVFFVATFTISQICGFYEYQISAGGVGPEIVTVIPSVFSPPNSFGLPYV